MGCPASKPAAEQDRADQEAKPAGEDSAAMNAESKDSVRDSLETPSRKNSARRLYTLTSSIPENHGDMQRLLAAFKSIACQLNPEKATSTIVEETCNLLEVEHAVLYEMDHKTNQLSHRAATFKVKQKTPESDSFVCQVASVGQLMMVNRALKSPSYGRMVTNVADMPLHSVLCVPALDSTGKTVAVLEALNKKPAGSTFTEGDKIMASNLAAVAAICIRNCQVYEEAIKNERRANALLDLVRALSTKNLGVNSLMFTVTRRAQELLDAQQCTFFVVDHKRGRLWSMSTDMESQIHTPLRRSVAGLVATEKKLLNITNLAEDKRFDPEVEALHCRDANSVLAAPIVATGEEGREGDARDCVAVLQVVNKMGGTGDPDDSLSGSHPEFTREDEDLLLHMCDLLGEKVEAWSLLESFQGASVGSELTEGGRFEGQSAFNTMEVPYSPSHSKRRKNSLASPVMEEEENPFVDSEGQSSMDADAEEVLEGSVHKSHSSATHGSSTR
eukprot:jgi/Mesvir1/2639/Mv04399-RA.1